MVNHRELKGQMVKSAKLNAGIIGYGYMGKIRKKIIEENPYLNLTGICDINKSTLPLEETHNYKKYTDYKKLLNPDVHIIFVCTPNAASPEIVIECLNSGKHVFCEKPPGRTLADIKMMIRTEKKHPELKLMFGFNHRYHPGILEAKKMVDGGRLGKILFIKGTYGKSGGTNYLSSWRNQKDISGGGILLDQGIHMLDLFRYFCGDFTEIKGFLSQMYWSADVEDNAFIFMRNSNGQVATLHSSATLWKHCFKMEIFLEHAYLVIQGLLSKTGSYGRETLIVGKRQFEDETFALGNPREESIYFDQDNSWSIEVDRFTECVLNNKPVEGGSSRDSLKVMGIIDKIYRDEKIIGRKEKKL